MRALFSLKTVSTAAAGLAALLVFAAPAMAKQCVWNKGGFVVRVDWFNPGTVTSAKAADGYIEFAFAEQPVQTDVFPIAQGRCINRGKTAYTAVVSIYASLPFSRVVAYPDDWSEERRIDAGIQFVLTPSTTRWLDVWGGVDDPQHGPGGGI